ncbi:GNAT family N-acetyltransferase [Actinomadura livida]|uniref:GNAT family N-acetyltransferase n=1 Tax=Actinomadura livida TaxID=79909 RepID=A0A7W7IJW6_9ACTN|nr:MULTISPECIES: GNAT family N-acetyltransferase [Actinomadura]MBB4778466.1 GNAT superfamily N-acetyltransferase [Actinomadura catellatispora]GGU24336.1 acetyltransferase [Actinomadura livida]
MRLLGIDELGACQRLAKDRGWGPEDHKWRFLFSVGHVYGVDDGNGELAGTVVCTPYGKDVAAISMVLVAKRFERRGLGGRMMRHVMDEAGTASTCLTATDYGRPLYERMGFRSMGLCTTYTGVSEGSSHRSATKPVEEADMAAVHALDTEVFGADRSQVVDGLPTFCETLRVVRDGTGIAGYGGAWRNGAQVIVGPIIAQDAETALTLVDEVVPEGLVRLDIDHRHPELIDWAERHGLRPAFTTTIMEFGAPVANDPSRLFLPVAQALG